MCVSGKKKQARIFSAWYGRCYCYKERACLVTATETETREAAESWPVWHQYNCWWSVTVSDLRLEPRHEELKSNAVTLHVHDQWGSCDEFPSDVFRTALVCCHAHAWSSAGSVVSSSRSGDQWGMQILLQAGTMHSVNICLFEKKIHMSVSHRLKEHLWHSMYHFAV